MTARPIIFDTESINAILSGRKWQTRRLVTGTALEFLESGFTLECVALPDNKCSRYGYPGDLLWVRETWQWAEHRAPPMGSGLSSVVYRADNPPHHWDKKPLGAWRSPMFMPRNVSRLTLRLTDVRVERLQDITVDDIRAEGLAPDNEASLLWRENIRAKWLLRWDGINGKKAPWASNPWIWALSFERVEE